MDKTLGTRIENLYIEITENPIDSFTPGSNVLRLIEIIKLSKSKKLSDRVKKEMECCMLENINHSFKADINEIYQSILSSATIRNQFEYSHKSVIKELFQNIFDCKYNMPAEIVVELENESKTISFKFNETGFSIYDIYQYLGIGNGEKSQVHTGRFGIGAKFGIFLNCKKVLVESCNLENVYNFCVIRSKDRKK